MWEELPEPDVTREHLQARVRAKASVLPFLAVGEGRGGGGHILYCDAKKIRHPPVLAGAAQLGAYANFCGRDI